jgi:hypothetical protein
MPTPQAVAKKIVEVVGPIALKQAKKFWDTDHGSKVKQGAYHECPVEMFADKACIVVNEERGEIVLLTSDNVESYRYMKEKKRLNGVQMHTYYYYEIDFKNGEHSYVRMRRKYREAMERYC